MQWLNARVTHMCANVNPESLRLCHFIMSLLFSMCSSAYTCNAITLTQILPLSLSLYHFPQPSRRCVSIRNRIESNMRAERSESITICVLHKSPTICPHYFYLCNASAETDRDSRTQHNRPHEREVEEEKKNKRNKRHCRTLQAFHGI